jgi:hypothetical protein
MTGWGKYAFFFNSWRLDLQKMMECGMSADWNGDQAGGAQMAQRQEWSTNGALLRLLDSEGLKTVVAAARLATLIGCFSR